MKSTSLALCFILLASIQNLRADSPAAPFSYKQVTKNGKYVFVMLVHTAGDQESKALQAQYPNSGLYRNDGSRTPLWNVGWYAFKVDVSSDGKHLVKGGEWPQIGDKGEAEAVSF